MIIKYMILKKIKTWGVFIPATSVIVIFALIGVKLLYSTHALSPTGSSPSQSFNYGFDLDASSPTSPTASGSNSQQAVTSAINVLGNFNGSFVDQSIYGFGAKNPQPNPVPLDTPLDSSNTDLSSIESRINLITSKGGVPVITLVAAPPWMVSCMNYAVGQCPGGDSSSGCMSDPGNTSLFATPPCPAHYQDFAKLAAYIAKSFPQVKYFVVWSEMRGFYNNQTKSTDATNYTNLYNDIYSSIKNVRSDALVGGPYADWVTTPCNQPPNFPQACTQGSISGSWGSISHDTMQAVQYWLANKVGADFIAMDGGTEIASKCTTSISAGYSCSSGNNISIDPVTASQKYAAVDGWVQSQTNLPIWWMESHIQPAPSTPTQWTDQQAAAARIATLIIMNASGASVGMQWNPQDSPTWADEGLWTDTNTSNGGQATTLGNELAGLLPEIREPLSLVGGQSSGVLVATNSSNVIMVNTNNSSSTAFYGNEKVDLISGQIVSEPKNSTKTQGGSTPTPTSPAAQSSSQPDESTRPLDSGVTKTLVTSNLSNPSNISGLNYQDDSKSTVLSFNQTNVLKAQYYLGKKLLATITSSPFTYRLDKTHILNGTYTYKVVVYYTNGQMKSASAIIKVNNKFGTTQIGLFIINYYIQLILIIGFAALVFTLFVNKDFLRSLLKSKD